MALQDRVQITAIPLEHVVHAMSASSNNVTCCLFIDLVSLVYRICKILTALPSQPCSKDA